MVNGVGSWLIALGRRSEMVQKKINCAVSRFANIKKKARKRKKPKSRKPPPFCKMAAPMKPRSHALADRLPTAQLFLQLQITEITRFLFYFHSSKAKQYSLFSRQHSISGCLKFFLYVGLIGDFLQSVFIICHFYLD